MAKNPTQPKNSAKSTIKLLDLSQPELAKKICDLKAELITLKRNTLIGDVQNVHAYKYQRRELARLLTAFNKQPVAKEK